MDYCKNCDYCSQDYNYHKGEYYYYCSNKMFLANTIKGEKWSADEISGKPACSRYVHAKRCVWCRYIKTGKTFLTRNTYYYCGKHCGSGNPADYKISDSMANDRCDCEDYKRKI